MNRNIFYLLLSLSFSFMIFWFVNGAAILLLRDYGFISSIFDPAAASLFLIEFSIFSMFVFVLFYRFQKQEEEKDVIFWRLNLLDSSLQTTNLIVVIFDVSNRIIYTNDYFVSQFKELLESKNILGKKLSELNDSKNFQKIESDNIKCLVSKEEYREKMILNQKKYEILRSPLFDEHSESIGLVFMGIEASKECF